MRSHTFTIFLRGFYRSAIKFLQRKNDRKNIVNACIYIYFCRSEIEIHITKAITRDKTKINLSHKGLQMAH